MTRRERSQSPGRRAERLTAAGHGVPAALVAATLTLALAAAAAAATAPSDEARLRRWAQVAPAGVYERGDALVVIAVVGEARGLRSPIDVEAELMVQAADRLLDHLGLDPAPRRAAVPIPGPVGDRAWQIYRLRASDTAVSVPGSGRLLWREVGRRKGRLALELRVADVAALRARGAAPDWRELEALAVTELEADRRSDVLGPYYRAHGLVFDSLRVGLAGDARFVGLSRREGAVGAGAGAETVALSPRAHLRAAEGGPVAERPLHLVAALAGREPELRRRALALAPAVLGTDPAGSEYARLLAVLDRGAEEDPLVARAAQWEVWPVVLAASSGGHLVLGGGYARRRTAEIARALVSFRRGDPAEDLLETYLAAIASAPRNAEGWAYAAAVLRYLGRDRLAVAFLHESLMLDPSSVPARRNLERSYAALGFNALARAIADMTRTEEAALGAGQSAQAAPVPPRSVSGQAHETKGEKS